MSKASILVTFIVGFVALAGCAEKGSVAPSATVSADLGAIEGTVIDEEQLVVTSAAVGLEQSGNTSTQQTVTSASGTFAFPNLTPGLYRVHVQSPFFGPSTTKVDVIAGQVAKLVITLKRIANTSASDPLVMDPYVEKGFINLAYSFPWTSGDTLGGSLGQGAPNEKSHFPLTIKKEMPLKEVVAELVWTPGSAGSGTWLQLLICSKLAVQDTQNNCYGFGPNPDYVSDRVEGPSPLVLRVTDLPLKEVEQFEVMVGDGGLSTSPPRAPVTFQQAFDLYVTMCYYQNCTVDYQARPPA